MSSMLAGEIGSLLNAVFAIVNGLLGAWVQNPLVTGNTMALTSDGNTLVTGVASIIQNVVTILNSVIGTLAR